MYKLSATIFLRFFALLILLMEIYFLSPFSNETLSFLPFFFLIGGLLGLFIHDWRFYSLFVTGPILMFNLELCRISMEKNQTLPLVSIILIPLTLFTTAIVGKNHQVVKLI